MLMSPPTTQAAKMGAGAGTRAATVCGTTKMPAPMTLPMTSMVMSNRPSRGARAGASGTATFSGPAGGSGSMFTVMRSPYRVSPGMRHSSRLTARSAGRKDNPSQGLRHEREERMGAACRPRRACIARPHHRRQLERVPRAIDWMRLALSHYFPKGLEAGTLHLAGTRRVSCYTVCHGFHHGLETAPLRHRAGGRLAR